MHAQTSPVCKHVSSGSICVGDMFTSSWPSTMRYLVPNSHILFVQICRWEFLAFSGTFKTLLNVHEERDAGRVVFSLIKSSFMKDFEGQWQVRHYLNNATLVLNSKRDAYLICGTTFAAYPPGHACYCAPAVHITATYAY